MRAIGSRLHGGASFRHLPTRLTLTHGLMVVAALVTFVGVSSVLRDRGATVEVLVAGADLDRGSILEARHLTVVTVPATDPLLTHLVNPARFVGGQLQRSVRTGEPLLVTDVIAPSSGFGARTFTLPVSDRTIGGLGLVVGDRVDVVGVDSDGRPGFVVSDVSVVRLPESSPGIALGGPLGSAFVTVEVSDREVLDLVMALRADDLQIVRSTGAPAPENRGEEGA